MSDNEKLIAELRQRIEELEAEKIAIEEEVEDLSEVIRRRTITPIRVQDRVSHRNFVSRQIAPEQFRDIIERKLLGLIMDRIRAMGVVVWRERSDPETGAMTYEAEIEIATDTPDEDEPAGNSDHNENHEQP